jgi:hypothetical protein
MHSKILVWNEHKRENLVLFVFTVTFMVANETSLFISAIYSVFDHTINKYSSLPGCENTPTGISCVLYDLSPRDVVHSLPLNTFCLSSRHSSHISFASCFSHHTTTTVYRWQQLQIDAKVHLAVVSPFFYGIGEMWQGVLIFRYLQRSF